MKDNLKKMFDEQNAKILKNKIALDIDNNTDSLRLTISNVIILEMNKLLKNITKFSLDNNIICNQEKLDKLLEDEKTKLKEITDIELDRRKQRFLSELEEIEEEKNKYEQLNIEAIENMKLGITKEMSICFLPKLIRMQKINKEEELIRINGLVRLTSNTIQNRIENNMVTRFFNLVNMIDESRDTSTKMLEKTDKALKKIERITELENKSNDKQKIMKKAS